MTPIRAALFDVDGTLYHQLPVRLCMAVEMALHFAALGAPWHCGGRQRRCSPSARSVRSFAGRSHEARARRPAVRRDRPQNGRRARRCPAAGRRVDAGPAEQVSQARAPSRRRVARRRTCRAAASGSARFPTIRPERETRGARPWRSRSRRRSAPPTPRSTRSSRIRADSCARASCGDCRRPKSSTSAIAPDVDAAGAAAAGMRLR